MTKTLEKGEDKIQKICDALRRETLEPAKEEAEQLIDDAKRRAAALVEKGETEVEKMLASARSTIEKERHVFHSSLEQAAQQCMEELRQSIQNKLFNEEIHHMLSSETTDPKVIAKLIDSVVSSIEKDGISADLEAVIPKAVSKEEVNQLLAKNILKKLAKESVQVDTFAGGVQVKLKDKKMTIDITEKSLKELLAHYLRKDFRNLLFGE